MASLSRLHDRNTYTNTNTHADTNTNTNINIRDSYSQGIRIVSGLAGCTMEDRGCIHNNGDPCKIARCFVSQYCENLCNGDSVRTDNGKEVTIKMNSLVTLARGQLLQVVIELKVIPLNPVDWLQNTLQPIAVQINCLSSFAIWHKKSTWQWCYILSVQGWLPGW